MIVDTPSIVSHSCADIHGDGLCAYGWHHLLHSQRLHQQGTSQFAANPDGIVQESQAVSAVALRRQIRSLTGLCFMMVTLDLTTRHGQTSNGDLSLDKWRPTWSVGKGLMALLTFSKYVAVCLVQCSIWVMLSISGS